MNALAICERALRLLRLYGVGETPSAEDLTGAFNSLNYMLDSMSADTLIPVQQLRSFPTTGATSYTIGPTGNVVAPRPTALGVSNTVQLGENEFPLTVLTVTDYQTVGYKTSDGMPECISLELTAPNAKLYVWPVSNGYTINLRTIEPLTQFTDINTDIPLLPGVAEMLQYQLAMAIAPEYDVEPSPMVIARASNLMRLVKRQFLQVPMLSTNALNTDDRDSGRALFS
jgi:hypothetical protein